MTQLPVAQGGRGGFLEFLRTSEAQTVIWLAVLASLIAVAVYVVRYFREQWRQPTADASEMISKFRELHAEGELSDTEFRTIKTILGPELRRQVADREKPDEQSE